MWHRFVICHGLRRQYIGILVRWSKFLEYRSRDADPDADPNTRADPNPVADTDTDTDTNPVADTHTDTHPSPDSNADAHASADPNAIADAHTDASTHANPNAIADTHTDASTHANTNTHADAYADHLPRHWPRHDIGSDYVGHSGADLDWRRAGHLFGRRRYPRDDHQFHRPDMAGASG